MRVLAKEKPCAVASWLLDQEEREAAVRERAIGVGAREHNSTSARAANVHQVFVAVDEPAALGLASRSS